MRAKLLALLVAATMIGGLASSASAQRGYYHGRHGYHHHHWRHWSGHHRCHWRGHHRVCIMR